MEYFRDLVIRKGLNTIKFNDLAHMSYLISLHLFEGGQLTLTAFVDNKRRAHSADLRAKKMAVDCSGTTGEKVADNH